MKSSSTSIVRLPDFIIAGAPRCGTTWLYHLFDKHPAIYLARPATPEPKFFLVDEIYRKGIDFYKEKWFSNNLSRKICGEKTTNYLENKAVPERIKKHIPLVKLIFILRNPVDRAYSNYLWSKKNGYEKYSFKQALALENKREQHLPKHLKYARVHAYFSRGLYADLLEPYLKAFPRKNILILNYDSILNDPQSLAITLHDFLKISSRPHDSVGLGVVNPSIPDAPEIEKEVFLELRQRYKRANKKLALLLGQRFQMWDA